MISHTLGISQKTVIKELSFSADIKMKNYKIKTVFLASMGQRVNYKNCTYFMIFISIFVENCL